MSKVVLVHASGLSARQWSRWSLPDPAPVELWGCGASPGWPGPWPFRLRADLDRVLAALEPGVDLVGHSYGGALALFAAAERPDLVRRVALYEAPLVGLLDAATIDADLPPGFRDPAAEGTEAWLEAFVDWWNGPGAYRALAEPVRTALWRARREVFGQVMDLVADRRTLATYADLGPVLVLRGGRTPPVVARALDVLSRRPGVEGETFPDLGHMGPLTDPGRVSARVARFLRS